MDTQDPTHEVAYPYELADMLVRAKHLTREQFLHAWRTLTVWHRQMGLDREPLSKDPRRDGTMKFVDYKLTREEIAEAAAWLDPNDIAFDELVNQTIRQGYRFSVTYDANNSAVIVTLMSKDPTCVNNGFGMSTRHATVRAALHLSLFKHYVVFDGGAWSDATGASNFG